MKNDLVTELNHEQAGASDVSRKFKYLQVANVNGVVEEINQLLATLHPRNHKYA
jgi:hypothetical protein